VYHLIERPDYNSQYQWVVLTDVRMSERGFTSEQRKKVIYGRIKHGKRRNNREG